MGVSGGVKEQNGYLGVKVVGWPEIEEGLEEGGLDSLDSERVGWVEGSGALL